jgi:hypothetical protein
MKPWNGIIPQSEQEAYRAAGFGKRWGRDVDERLAQRDRDGNAAAGVRDPDSVNMIEILHPA